MSSIEKEKFAAIILSAGNSSRMGKHKALLPFNENENFIQHIANEFWNFGCEKVIVVTNENLFVELQDFINQNIVVIKNTKPELGRFYSLFLASNFVLNYSYVFMHNVDNPFVNKTILEILSQNKDAESFVVPVFEAKGGHPILLSKKIITQIHNQLTYNLNIHDFLQLFQRKNVIFDVKDVLKNINSQQEYFEEFKNKLKNI